MESILAIRVVIYGPFALSLLGLIPHSDWLVSKKIGEVAGSGSTQTEEIRRTFDLVDKFEKLVEVSLFDILYAYLNLAAVFLELKGCIPKSTAALGVILLFTYHVILIFLGKRLYDDYIRMNYSSLHENYFKVFFFRLAGERYLTLFFVFLVLLAAGFVALARWLLLGYF